jgi:hypothetical protein
MGSMLINKKQDFTISSALLSIKLCRAFSKYFDRQRICISFIFCKQSLDIPEATWTYYFFSHKRQQFITSISAVCEEYGNPLLTFYIAIAKILKTESFARL